MQQEIWFSKYRIIRQLGIGGTAKVYLAEHTKLNSYRVIKCISKKNPLYEIQLKEAKILKGLQHPCIPIIYDIEESEECSYIIEQYLEGDTLREYVNNRGSLSEDIIVAYAIQICDLIHYLHSIERPILYLDIKPDNIIVMADRIKLIDFGSAVYQDEASLKQHYYGTRGYAAPELYQGMADERSDVYGIGMLLYYMSSGAALRKDVSEIANIDFNKKCSMKLKRIINRCLKYNPSQRYASVMQLCEQITAIERKWKNYNKNPSYPIRIAIAGAQPRIGVTHMAFMLSTYYISHNYCCLYEEKNSSNCAWAMKGRYEGTAGDGGIFSLHNIPILPKGQLKHYVDREYQIRIQDFGCLTKDNLDEFSDAEVRILILGTKDWELNTSEEKLEMVAEYKDIIYLINYVDGRQFQEVLKSMDRKNCFRIPYSPDPFRKHNNNIYELLKEINRIGRMAKAI